MMNAAGLSSPDSTDSSTYSQSPTDVELEEFTAFEGGANTAYSSPAIPTVFDFSGSASSSTTNLATISPQDLLVHDFMSAPNSAALTHLTSPSMYGESPEFDYADVSPNFGSTDFGASAEWFSLFPQDASAVTAAPEKSSVENSPAQKSDDSDLGSRPPSSRRKSGGSPPSTRHSSVSGVAARKRDKPLPPIIVEDPSDTIAMKRARNTLAARKSRERKAQRFEELEERIAKLEEERDHWKRIALAQAGAHTN
jgi:general control protein GCN4